VDDDLTLSNGLGWSPDGGTFYSIDSLRGAVFARSYPSGERTVLLQFPDEVPDGMCVDTDGNLWIAIWGAGEVRSFTPTGELRGVVTVPAPHTTCPAFAGPGLDVLVITTATAELTPEQLSAYPLSGHLFTARVGATGLPATPWAGFSSARM
jgi:sugar lactone lactonase YvrE